MYQEITNKDPNFYQIMGPVFGSRKIERKTKDRFYDDDSKIWHLNITNGIVDVAISVKGHVLTNIYIDDENQGLMILTKLHPYITLSTVPIIYQNIYEDAGYKITNPSTNFVKITGGYNESEN